jgi:hypothetical protein
VGGEGKGEGRGEGKGPSGDDGTKGTGEERRREGAKEYDERREAGGS